MLFITKLPHRMKIVFVCFLFLNFTRVSSNLGCRGPTKEKKKVIRLIFVFVCTFFTRHSVVYVVKCDKSTRVFAYYTSFRVSHGAAAAAVAAAAVATTTTRRSIWKTRGGVRRLRIFLRFFACGRIFRFFSFRPTPPRAERTLPAPPRLVMAVVARSCSAF